MVWVLGASGLVPPPVMRRPLLTSRRRGGQLVAQLSASDVQAALCLAGSAGMASKFENRWQWARAVTAPMVALSIACVLANLGLLPASDRAMTACWEVALPLSLSTTIVGGRGDLKRDAKRIWRVGAAFVVGSLASVVGSLLPVVVAAFMGGSFLRCEADAVAAGCAALCASYVGGSANFFAVSRAIDAPLDLASALAAADVIVMAAYFAALTAIARRTQQPDVVVVTAQTQKETSSFFSIAGAIFAGLSIVLLTRLSCEAPGLRTAALALLSSAMALAAKPRFQSAAKPVATASMLLFYAALGASAQVSNVLRSGAAALALAAIALLGHALLLAAAFRLFPRNKKRPSLAETLVASNACIGGPSTAAAFALAIDRADLALPAVIWGTVGYGLATSLGIAIHPFFLAILPRP